MTIIGKIQIVGGGVGGWKWLDARKAKITLPILPCRCRRSRQCFDMSMLSFIWLTCATWFASSCMILPEAKTITHTIGAMKKVKPEQNRLSARWQIPLTIFNTPCVRELFSITCSKGTRDESACQQLARMARTLRYCGGAR